MVNCCWLVWSICKKNLDAEDFKIILSVSVGLTVKIYCYLTLHSLSSRVWNLKKLNSSYAVGAWLSYILVSGGA